MGTPTFKFVYDRKKRASSTKEGAVELRITYNRVQRFVTTGVRCLPKHWRNGTITNRMDAFEMQNTLDVFLTRARRIVNDLIEGGSLDMDCLVPAINGRMGEQSQQQVSCKRPMIDYFKERAAVRKYGRAKDSQKRYDRFIAWMERWGGMLTFDDITEANILKMDAALAATGMVEKSKWHNYHRFLNSFIMDSIDEGMLKKNPYKRLHIGRGDEKDGLSKYLSREEFERIVGLNLPTNYLMHARDLFVFQTYTGMAYVDLAAFDAERIVDVNGKPMYRDKRGKTRQEFSFVLLPPALDILRKYGNKLPLMSNQKYNDRLKVLAVMAGIDKPLSSHWARHTCATMLLNSGVDMEVVARVLGHSSTKMTRDVYAKLLDNTIANEMGKLRL